MKKSLLLITCLISISLIVAIKIPWQGPSISTGYENQDWDQKFRDDVTEFFRKLNQLQRLEDESTLSGDQLRIHAALHKELRGKAIALSTFAHNMIRTTKKELEAAQKKNDVKAINFLQDNLAFYTTIYEMLKNVDYQTDLRKL